MRALLLVLQLRVVQPLAEPPPRVVQSPTEQCGPVERPFNEFEVSRPASSTSRPSDGPRPARDPVAARRHGADSVIVEFIIDTTGSPVPRSFRVLKSPSRAIADRVRDAHVLWRFRPALIGGCKVPQVVQTPVEWVAVSAPGRGPP
jgi:hypothetical protein